MDHSRERILSAVLVIGLFYFGFMNLDRILSLIYGFNFQPFGDYVPRGFTYWGHVGNGSAAATGLYITFKIEELGRRRGNQVLQNLGYLIFAFIGTFIPYMNDSDHLARHGVSSTLVPYLIGNAVYVFGLGWVSYRLADSSRKKMIAIVVFASVFLVVHFLFYSPRFPEFYWS